MSGNVCLDPTPFYSAETLTCENSHSGEGNPPETTAQAPKAAQARSLVAARPRPVLNLDDYSSLIASRAASGSSAPERPLSQSNPLAYSLLSLLPVACGNGSVPFPTNETDSGSNGGTDGGTPPVDAGNGGDTGTGGTDGGTDGGVDPSDPTPGMAVSHDTTPCGADGTITDLDDGVGVCANFTDSTHHLYTWDPSTGGALASVVPLSYAPDQVLQSSSTLFFITNHGDASAMPAILPGMAIIDSGMGFQQQQIFPNVVLPPLSTDSAGSSVSTVSPSFPKGLVESGDRIFVATSNLMTQAEAVNNYFNPGTVLIYSKSSGNWIHSLATTGYNPTSVGEIGGNIYVVNSGDINPARVPTVNSPSSIDIIDPSTLEIIQSIDLGNVAAGISGEIAVSSDGNTMVLPTGDNSGRLIVVDLSGTTPSSREITVTTGTQVFLNGVTFHPSSDRYIYAGNFNDGNLYTVDLDTDMVVGTPQNLDADTSDFSGISDGLTSGASLFMGVGPAIMRLPLSSM